MTIRARKLASLIGAMCLSAASLAGAAGAPPMQLNIAAQPIDDALREFGRQSGLQVFLASVEGVGVTASAVNGSYTPTEALQKLLSNTGLRYEYIDERTIAIRPIAPRSEGFQKTSNRLLGPAEAASETRASTKSLDDAVTIETVNVFGTLDDELSVGSKSGQTLRETPKSITILSNERIEAQQITSLQEALIQTTGVAVSAFTPLDTFFYSRGIRLQTLQFDGGAPAFNGGFGFSYTPDTAILERIEVLRGVDGIYSGAGEPGGVINLVRKTPKRNTEVRLDLSGGSWDNYRGVLDVTGPLALDGRLRGRAVASYMDRGYFWDRYTTEKQIFYGTLEMDITDSTLLAVGMSHEQREDDSYPGFGGFPRYSNAASLGLPRDYNIAAEWARFHIKTRDVFAKLEQRYGDSGVLKLNVSQIDQTGQLRFMGSYGTVNPVTLTGPYMYGSASDTSPKQRLADLSASGKFELFGRSHRYTVGVDRAELDGGGQQDYRVAGFAFNNGVPYNIFTDQIWLRPEPAFTQNPFIAYPINEQSQRGIYATVGLQLAEPLRLTLGGRQGKYNYHQESRNATTGVRSVVR
ncbi:TonB-dependent siderophore receptor, partial [Steroidobacter sp.]|uniref:TonB-dependent siderophore receptor n=1 Tax=Steroidobacter sp. TaxID=1978227 RepID=UPI001A541434